MTPSDELVTSFPEYFSQPTEEGVLLCILGPADDYKKAVRDAVHYITENKQPALLITPRESIEDLHSIIEPYAVVGIIQPTTFRQFSDVDLIRDLVEVVELEYNRKQSLFEEEGISQGDIRWVFEDHPSLLKGELSKLQLLRENSANERAGIGESIWREFEKTVKAAFGTLDIEFKMGVGGVDNHGEEIEDIFIAIKQTDAIASVDEVKRVWGVVDAKSGSTAGFESESVAKQLEYFEDQKTDRMLNEDMHLHLFVVFDVDPDAMVDFYETARSQYPDGTGFVVMTANALRQMIDVMQSPSAKSVINRYEGTPRHVFRYFFDPQLYSRPEFSKYADMPTLSEWGADDEDTQELYEGTPEMLFVTQEMVDAWVWETLEDEQMIDTLFERRLPK